MKIFNSKFVIKLFVIFLIIFVLHKICLHFKPFGSLLKNISFSRQVVDRNDKLLRLTLAEDDKYRVYTSLKNISPLAIESTLIYEDKFFYIHPGINPFSVFRAAWVTFIQKKRVIGASTITMQLSRCLYNINTKSLTGKLRQMFSALKLEFLYSKNEILEAYFNIVPYGFNIEGIGAASLVYFNKYSQRLTLLEALTLTVIPQSPYKRTKHIKKKTVL